MGKKTTNLHCQACRRKRQSSGNSYHGLDPELVKMVRHIAVKSIGKAGLKEHDLPDIEQELMLTVFTGIHRHDLARSHRLRFAKLLAETAVRQIFRRRNSYTGRICRSMISLNQEIQMDGESAEMIELVNDEAMFEQPNTRSAIGSYDDLNARLDIEARLANYPFVIKLLLEALLEQDIPETSGTRNKHQKTAPQ